MSYIHIERALDRDNFMTAYEAKEFGIIDNVLEHGIQTPNDTSTNDKEDV